MICLLVLLGSADATLFHAHSRYIWPWEQALCCGINSDGISRARIQSLLERTEGHHLVIVRYGSNHSVHSEWVYNRADIDTSRVVWARDMGPAENQELIDYFGDHRLWLLEPDENPPRLLPYSRVSNR